MTSNELKQILDRHINSLILKEGSNGSGFYILLTRHHYEKAKYSCTTDEEDFTYINGKVFYRGFQLSTSKGIMPYIK